MENEATVEMPVTLTREMLRALQENDLTRIDDREERYLRIGWLVCAWDVLIEQRTGLPPNKSYAPDPPDNTLRER